VIRDRVKKLGPAIAARNGVAAAVQEIEALF